jgi:predicted DCC family thiol-disulfide oxidoreductase YuxK
MYSNRAHAVLVFDGVCNLCNALVRFILKRDPGAYFKFVSLQSGPGADLLKGCRLPAEDMDTVVLFENEKCYTRSAAVLRVFRRLHRLWPLLYGFIIVPSFLRDAVYRFVARNRYRWFGKMETCFIPSPGDRERFLTEE